MKKILSLVFLAFISAATLISCELETSPVDDPQQIIVVPEMVLYHKWKKVGALYHPIGEDEAVLFPHSHDCPELPDYLEFKNNGIMIDVDNDENCISGTSLSSPYTFTEGVIFISRTVNNEPYVQRLKVISLVDTTLVLQDLDLDPNGELRVVLEILE